MGTGPKCLSKRADADWRPDGFGLRANEDLIRKGSDVTCWVANGRFDDPPTPVVVDEVDEWDQDTRDNADVNCWRAAMVCCPATNWLQKRVLLHSVHFASRALAKARLISTRVIVIEDNQRSHSCVAQVCQACMSLATVHLQYVMTARRRLMRAREA